MEEIICQTENISQANMINERANMLCEIAAESEIYKIKMMCA